MKGFAFGALRLWLAVCDNHAVLVFSGEVLCDNDLELSEAAEQARTLSH